MWQYNETYGGEEMRGWLYVQGNWSWGSVLTWHVVDIGGYWWMCHCWWWSSMFQCWRHDFVVSDGTLQPNIVEDWMVHDI